MIPRPTRALAWLPLREVPLFALMCSGLVGCELLVNVDPMVVDGSPDDVVIPKTLDGYDCPICKDVSPDAEFDGPFFPEAGPEDSGRVRDSGGESSMMDSDVRDGERADAQDAEPD
jgi:hypothetical protein